MKPQLKTQDKCDEYLKIAKEYVKKISSNKGVIGVAVGGGLGRGHSDEFSDVDIFVYLTDKGYNKWSKNPPLRVGSFKRGKCTVDIEIFNFNKENNPKKSWKIEDRWERQSHFTLFDTNKKVEKLLKEKCVWEKGERQNLLKELLKKCEWYLWISGTFIKRGDLKQAQYHLNIVIDWILDIVFLKNNHFIPWSKWKLHYALLMKKKPKDFEKNLKEAMKLKSFDEKDIRRRTKAINKILRGFK